MTRRRDIDELGRPSDPICEALGWEHAPSLERGMLCYRVYIDHGGYNGGYIHVTEGRGAVLRAIPLEDIPMLLALGEVIDAGISLAYGKRDVYHTVVEVPYLTKRLGLGV